MSVLLSSPKPAPEITRLFLPAKKYRFHYYVSIGGVFLEEGSSGYSAGRHHGDHLFAADYPEPCAAEPDREDPVL